MGIARELTLRLRTKVSQDGIGMLLDGGDRVFAGRALVNVGANLADRFFLKLPQQEGFELILRRARFVLA